MYNFTTISVKLKKMCGIWGSFNSTDNSLYELYMNIKPRGPDQSTLFNFHSNLIGFHRLAIMDLSPSGDQPFRYFKDSRIVYATINGEIYNYSELKLETPNYKYQSNSDCEVVLALYLEYGIEETLKRINGEFAIAIHDFTLNGTTNAYDKKLLLARDRFGIRPLFYTISDNVLVYSSEMKGLPQSLKTGIIQKFSHIEPRTYIEFKEFDDKISMSSASYYELESYELYNYHLTDGECSNGTQYEIFNYFDNNYRHYYDHNKHQNGDIDKYGNDNNFKKNNGKPIITDEIMALKFIYDTLYTSVEVRLESERPVGCLLSGGLDSSLISAIASDIMKAQGKKLHTFSIGMKGSPDTKYAQMVADHIGSIHTTVEIPQQEWIDAIDEIVRISETYDITTIRATTGQYLISKWIRANTDIKVLLIGDGSDELCSGYLYFHKAPSPEASHEENKRLLNDIHKYDVLRADRGVASNGLEARVPFLDRFFVDLYLSIDPKLRIPRNGSEKYLLRKAFEESELLPKEVLWRKKEAFSDGVSSEDNSWYKILQKSINSIKPVLNSTIDESHFTSEKKPSEETKEYPKQSQIKKEDMTPEGLYYWTIYNKYYPNQSHIIQYYWMPKWIESKDPSARTLSIYTSS